MTKAGELGYAMGLMKVAKVSPADIDRSLKLVAELHGENPDIDPRQIIEEAAQRIYDEKQPSALSAGLMAGLPSALLSGVTTHLVNKGDNPGLALGTGLGAGTLFGSLHAIRQAIENAKVRKRRRARELMAV